MRSVLNHLRHIANKDMSMRLALLLNLSSRYLSERGYENHQQLNLLPRCFPYPNFMLWTFFNFCREGMTWICLPQAASSQTLGTILTALRTGSLMEACFATRWLSFCLGDCRNFDAAGNGWQIEQIKRLTARRICLHKRRDWRDGGHGRSLAPSWLWSMEGLMTLIIRRGDGGGWGGYRIQFAMVKNLTIV